MKLEAISCSDDTPVGTFVCGTGNYAYFVVPGPRIERFRWKTDPDRKPYPGEYERVRAIAFGREGVIS